MRRREAVVALRPLVEVLEARDGSVYLLTGPSGGDFAIRDAGPEVRAILRALRAPGTASEVAGRCEAVAVTNADVAEVVAALEPEGLLEVLPPDRTGALPSADLERFDRQLLHLRQQGAGTPEQERLRDTHVVVLGCGGLGSWAAWSIACLGIGSMTLVDFDTVELANLNRQLLFTTADIGRSKCEVAAERLRAFDPALAIAAVEDRIDGPGDVAALAAGADLVIACADSPPYDIARWIDAGCGAAGVPHVSAGQLPPLVRVGPFVVPGTTPCLGCLEASLRAGNVLYDELEAMRKADPRPAATLGPACGLIGSMIALDALAWLTGLHDPASLGKAITIDMRTMELTTTPVEADPRCACGAAG